MSSSDYTALKKFKEIQSSCEVNEIGDPLSSSWFDIPVGQTTDCKRTLGTGPTGSTGLRGATGFTGPIGIQGIPGPTNGGIFTVIAESNNGFNVNDASGFTFSFGGAAKAINYGFQIGADC